MKRKFAEAMNALQEDYIAEAMEPGKRHSYGLRIVAMAACLALMVAAGFGLFSHLQPQEPELRLPPVRDAGGSHVMLSEKYTPQRAFEKSDAVALVRVGTWLREDSENGYTFYEAEILELYKGELPEKIILKQDGDSTDTIEGYPLFICGNELLVYMRESTTGLYVENCYWITGSFSTVFTVMRNDKGTAYVEDKMDFWSDAVQNDAVRADLEVREEIWENYLAVDDYWEFKSRFVKEGTAFMLEDLLKYIK